MEEKKSPTEIGSGDNRENLQNERKSPSVSTSSICICRSLENLESNSSISLDLSRKDLQHLTEDIYKLLNLKHLHLEGNALSIIPEDFFQHLPKLVWLDLRYNRFKELPPGIGCHKQLKTLLLEGNPIKKLPVELGNLASLTALNLRHCPLEFPPPEVIQKGLPFILSFLRRCSNQNDDYSEPYSLEMPPVEKLNLTDITKSSLDLSDGWPNEEEKIRFQKLRDEFIQNEKEEHLANKMVANRSMPVLTPRTRTKENISHKSSMILSRGKKNLFPAVSSYNLMVQSKRVEEFRAAAIREMKERQALIEQRRKDKEALQKWRTQAKKMRDRKRILYTFSSEKEEMRVSQNAPYATDNVKSQDKLEGWKEPSRQNENMEKTDINAIKSLDDLRAAKYKEVENRIKQHTVMMKERRKRLTSVPQEDMERAKEDFEMVEKLEAEIAEMRKNLNKEYRFTAFTGELLPPSEKPLPPPKPQNIFSKMTF